MCGFCSFVYVKTNKDEVKRIISFGEGRTRQMYIYLSEIVGFDYHFIECKSPEIALSKVKKEINEGYPIVVGAFDMYYLEYLDKLYHNEHIPYHYFLVIGYDDTESIIYLYDCGRKDVQKLSYSNFYLGINTESKGISKPNTICKISANYIIRM